MPSQLHAEEPELWSNRLTYVQQFDPTTVFLVQNEADDEENAQMASDIIDYARSFLGKPYRSGGKGPSAFDCSGFTSFIFRDFGIDLKASSSDQYTQGQEVDIDDVRPGDLIFFRGRNSSAQRVGHVGIVAKVNDDGSVVFIHAATSAGIRYDSYPDGGYYSKRFVGTKRVID